MSIQRTIPINSTNEVRVQIANFEGRHRLDIRHFFNDDSSKPDNFKPTRKGINISTDLGDDLLKALSSILAEFGAGFDTANRGEG